MMARRWWPWLVLCGVLVLPGRAEAQQERSRPDRARMEEEIRERFEALMFRELELDDESGAAVAETLRSFRGPRADLSRRRRQLQRRMEGTGSQMSESEAVEVLDALVDLAREESDLMAREQEALLEVLTPPQVVRLYGLREQFGARLRQLRERGRRPGGSGAPHPPGLDPWFDILEP